MARLSALVAVCLLASISQTVLGAPEFPWMHRPTPSKPKTSTTTVVPPTTIALETTTTTKPKVHYSKTMSTTTTTTTMPTTSVPTPSIVSLETTTPIWETTTKPKVYYSRKMSTPSTSVPTPSIASLETTTRLESTTPSTPSTTTTETTTPSTPLTTETTPSTPLTTEATPSTPSTPMETTTTPYVIYSKKVSKHSKRPKSTTAQPTLPPIDFDCSKKDDGYYADPKDRCSSIYYACVGGQGRKLDCGNLVYDPETDGRSDTARCERREDSFRCTGTRKTTLPSTRGPTTPKLPIDCSILDDGWYPDPEAKCSHVFYSCSNQIAARFLCPGHMYFDVETKSCESFQDVVACAGKRSTTQMPKTTKKPIDKVPIDCSSLPSGLYVDPAKKCSNIYYVCSNGDGFRRVCPEGLFFDPEQKLCDWFDDVFVCSNKVKINTTASPKPSIASLPPPEYSCVGKEDGSYLPPGKKCSHVYYVCVGQVSYKLVCPHSLYYDIKNDACDRFNNLFDCSGKYPTSPTPSTTQKPREKVPIDCSKLPDGDFPDPANKCSNIFYSCSEYVGTRRQCPQGTFFDKIDDKVDVCELRENVPACGGFRPTTVKPTKAPPVTKLPFDCERRIDGNYQRSNCDTKYWSCVGGSTYLIVCPHGTFYDAEMDVCGYKDEIPACGGERPTSTMSTIPVPTPSVASLGTKKHHDYYKKTMSTSVPTPSIVSLETTTHMETTTKPKHYKKP